MRERYSKMQLTTYWRRMVAVICGAGCVGALVLYWSMNYMPKPAHQKVGMRSEVPMSPANCTTSGLTSIEAQDRLESMTASASRLTVESRVISGEELLAQNTWARIQEQYLWKRLLHNVRELWGMSLAEWGELFLDHLYDWVMNLQLFLARLIR